MRRGSLALFATSLVACFSPTDADPPGDGSSGSSGSTTNGSSTSSTATDPGPTTDPDTTVGPGETSDTDPTTTGSDDQPPEFESFTVNGSTSPAEVDEGGTIQLEASVTDDIGIASVEFFDGSESLGVVEAAPYELDLVVSSSESGSHAYRAVATDTGDQTAESEEVTLSINIVGGQVEVLREDLFRGTDFSGYVNGGTNADIPNRVLLAANEEGDDTSRIIGFDRDLNPQWNDTLPLDVSFSPTAGDSVFFVGGRSADGESLQYTQVDPTDGSTLSTTAIRTPTGLAAGWIRYWQEGLLLSTSDTALSFRDGLTGPAEWQIEATPFDIEPWSSHAFLAELAASNECSAGSTSCVQKVDSAGQILWTAGLGNDLLALAAKPDGGVFAAIRLGGDGVEIHDLDPSGMLISTFGLFPGEEYTVNDIDPDGSGGLVVAASEGPFETSASVVLRVDASGQVEWDQRGIFSQATPSFALTVEVADGKVYVFGLANQEATGLGSIGDAWIARLAL